MNKTLESIYNQSPIWFQNVLVSCYGIKLFKMKYGKTYRHAFRAYKGKDYTDYKQETDIQNAELRELISYAVVNSKFYQEFYKGIDTISIRTVDDLKLLPILEKEKLRAHIDEVYTIEPSKGIPAFTGGTTGKSLMVYYQKSDFQKRMAYLDAFKWRLGVDPFKSRKATFSGREFTNNEASAKRNVFWRNNWIYKQRLYSTFDLTEDKLPYYVEDLNKFKPEILNGFVSALYEVAKYIDKNKIPLLFTPKAIFTTSETLLPIHRELIEKVFKTKMYDQYASAEGAPFITECRCGNLHYNIDTGVIEALETEHGNEMLVTSFTTYGTPLIRYRIGDKVTFKDGRCPCGSCHPLVERIEGRQVEYLFSLERGKISLSHLADVIKGMPNCIVNMQFVQETMDTITVNLVVDKSIYSLEYEISIVNEMKFRFGQSTQIVLNLMDSIPREPSGKFALIKNKLAKTAQ